MRRLRQKRCPASKSLGRPPWWKLCASVPEGNRVQKRWLVTGGEDDERIQYIQFKAEKYGEIFSMKSLGDLYYWGAR